LSTDLLGGLFGLSEKENGRIEKTGRIGNKPPSKSVLKIFKNGPKNIKNRRFF